MMMEKTMIKLITRSNCGEPLSGGTSSQEYQLIAICVVVLDGYNLLVVVDIIKSCKLRLYVGKQGIFVNNRSTLLFRQALWFKSPRIRSTGGPRWLLVRFVQELGKVA